MKFLLLVAGVVLLQVSGIQSHKELFDECAKELGISEDALKAGPEANKDKPEFKCVQACVMKKQGELEAGNKINFDKVKENTPPKMADKVDEMIGFFKECAEAAKDVADECEFANAVKHCLHEKLPKGPHPH